ncbi:N-acetyl-gamma-glutamyl-phosphate reductase [Christiangramia forsetii]|uniref:N-acetyl-gamma-glutamyl-phosphate reductase n=2 Tax=Christiangramia forsetii TaxID=411153 RepID=ARGC_CHRFK|nr:N-acetyl-gamma-glutamyl-phosphate reductase [Christiangramia forsetii]A0M376.1 RecName: Full=N-acetyl-gamma-glutamyl-phosphate reductase; Short=AGPR; AltName: Full=N-acetyl-glutamate semialdehyde dehydrogenase; Short=NAGSA dehydrogenase [Christiangramia forsetii KT0803]GGG26567.1 N-acetyl-gamma-glutamyl-phosphate reductase [Christiangramia forsetii]CAL67071.1 N-acetyl-gamma-glutamyl-phosphate reductase [Christiangramia forsetii KT0803]
MIEAGIIGGAGYTAGELIRILLHHPEVNLNFVYSTSQLGKSLYSIHQDLIGDTEIEFTSKINKEADVVFLCLGHGNSKRFLSENKFSEKTKIVDLSTDFRMKANDHSFVYGMPELNQEEIKNANFIANPGCFATAITFAVLPLAKNGLLNDDVHVNAVTGATGAGTSLSATTHFTWRDNNFSAYKSFEHQHLQEIGQSFKQLQSDHTSEINFIPNRGNFSRGIHATAYTKFSGELEDAKKLYSEFYKDAAFTFLTDEELHLKQVVNTNKCLLRLQKFGNKLLITSVIDNLLKGASGQAVQNMNLMFGLEEKMGLNLKAGYF